MTSSLLAGAAGGHMSNPTRAKDVPNWASLARTVTPSTAEQWMQHANPDNRRINPHRVAAYALVTWVATPMATPICFCPDGELLNGHHRLLSVIRSGRAGDFLVCDNVPREHLNYGDVGLSRNAKQIGRMFGEDTSADSALRVLLNLLTGSSTWVSPTDMSDLRADWAKEVASTSAFRAVKQGTRQLRAGFTSVSLMLMRVYPDSAAPFLEGVRGLMSRTVAAHASGPGIANFVSWLDNSPPSVGGTRSLADARALAVAHEQFASGKHKHVIKPNASFALKKLIDAVNGVST